MTINSFAAEHDNVIEDVESFIRNLDSFNAGFTQTVYGQSGEEIDQATGVVNLHKPGKFHWAYQAPYTQYIVSDGETLWIYDEDLEQVTINDIDLAGQNSPASILAGKQDIKGHYNVSDLGELDAHVWVELQPKDPDQEFNAIRLGFQQDRLSAMILFDKLGHVTVIQFSDIRQNVQIDEELFNFDLPEGIDVIDSRQR